MTEKELRLLNRREMIELLTRQEEEQHARMACAAPEKTPAASSASTEKLPMLRRTKGNSGEL